MPRATIAHAHFVYTRAHLHFLPRCRSPSFALFYNRSSLCSASCLRVTSCPLPPALKPSLSLSTNNSEVSGEETRCTVNYKNKTNTKTVRQYIDLDVDILCPTKRGARVILLRSRKPCTPARYWKPYITSVMLYLLFYINSFTSSTH